MPIFAYNSIISAKRAIGNRPPLQYLLGVKLARAKNLLKSSDIPIEEIAHTLGFKTNWYFAHFFAKSTGVSPRDYRRAQSSPRL